MGTKNSLRRQQGWTVWGLAVVLVVVGFFALLILRLFPPYMTNMKLVRALNKVAAEPGVAGETKRSIINRFDKLLYIDYADTDVNLAEALTIEKTKYGVTLRIDYTTKVPIAYNVSALLEFHNSATVH